MLTALGHKMRATPAGRILPGIIAEASVEPGMRAVLASFIEDRRERPREILQRGVARGELPPDADIELMLDLLGGTVMYRELIAGKAVDDELHRAPRRQGARRVRRHHGRLSGAHAEPTGGGGPRPPPGPGRPA